MMKKSPKSDEEATTIQQKCLLFKKYIMPGRFNAKTSSEKPLFDQKANDDWNGGTLVDEVDALKNGTGEIDGQDSDNEDFFAEDARRDMPHERE